MLKEYYGNKYFNSFYTLEPFDQIIKLTVKTYDDSTYTWIIIKKNFTFFLYLCIRMIGKNINFDEKKIRNSDFYKNKKLNRIDDIDVNNVVVSKKESYGNKNSLKHFIGYNDNGIIRSLCIRLP